MLGKTKGTLALTAPPADDTSPPRDEPRYEDALAELERLVSAMEGSQLPLDALLDNYRRLAVFGFNRACDAALQAYQVVTCSGYNVFVGGCDHRVVNLEVVRVSPVATMRGGKGRMGAACFT